MSVLPPTTRRAAAALVLLVALCSATVGLAAPAGAETVASWNGGFNGQSIKGTDGVGHFAGQFTLDFGDTTAVAYCIDLHKPISPPATLTEQPWESATGRTSEQLSQIAWILDNYPAGSYGSAWQAAAIQGAIWHFSDSWDLKQDPAQQGGHGAELVALYNEIVAAAAPHTDGSQPAPSLAIDPVVGSAYSGDAITYHVTATGATADITVTVSGGGETFVDGGGNPLPSPQTLPATGGEVRVLRNTDGSGSVHAETTAIAQTGRVFIQPGSQMLILGSTASATATADANGNWAPRPTGSISVTKAVSGTTAPAVGTGSFEICLTPVGVEGATSDCKTFTAGESLAWDGLAYGQYQVTETTTGDFTTSSDPADGIVTLEGESATATVTNTYSEPTEETTPPGTDVGGTEATNPTSG
ncbi:MAG: thioester domain-containing protein, partial [Acidimicrobiia bacterium]